MLTPRQKQLRAFDVPALKAALVPVEITNNARRVLSLREWNRLCRRWHRTGGA